jgi:hypothetical protein
MLTPEQQSAIYDYSDSGYRRINEQLRNRAVTDRIRREIDILTSALKNLPDFRGDVFRGATIQDPKLLRKYRRVGEAITERAFSSTSRSPLKAFSGNVRFYVTSKQGKEIARWSAHPEEEEVLFQPGAQFKVLEYVRDGNDIEIFLEEL